MLLVVAVCAALVERARSGRGQVVDVAMVDAVALQYAMVLGMLQSGAWLRVREATRRTEAFRGPSRTEGRRRQPLRRRRPAHDRSARARRAPRTPRRPTAFRRPRNLQRG